MPTNLVWVYGKYAYIRSHAYYSVTITLADSLLIDADVYQISVTFIQ